MNEQGGARMRGRDPPLPGLRRQASANTTPTDMQRCKGDSESPDGRCCGCNYTHLLSPLGLAGMFDTHLFNNCLRSSPVWVLNVIKGVGERVRVKQASEWVSLLWLLYRSRGVPPPPSASYTISIAVCCLHGNQSATQESRE